MNSYIHYVNRFRFLLTFLAGILFYSCEKTEVSCSDNDIAIVGQQLFVSNTDVNTSAFRRTYFLSETGEVSLCDTTVFSGIAHDEFEIGVDSAMFRHCEDCLDLLEWYGPGCERGYTQTDEVHELINTVWKLSEISTIAETHYAPCFLEVQGFFHDNDVAGFSIGNSYQVLYELENQQITFKEPVGTLVGIFGYNRLIEDLFRDELFGELPVHYELTGNQLTLTNEEGVQFIFFAE